MRMPTALRDLDDRVLGRRRGGHPDDEQPDGRHPDGPGTADAGARSDQRETRVVERPAREPRGSGGPDRPGTGDGLRKSLSVFYRVARLVFLVLAAVVALGVLFVLAPTNPDNSVVQLVTDVADAAAGPFRDVFTVADDAERELVVNYAFAAVVYLVAALLVRTLPGGKA